MTKYIALLRGINVGGNHIIKMTDLKAAFVKAGFQEVSTYINSGNIFFTSEMTASEARTACERLIAEGFGMEIPVCVISADEVIEALAHAPEWWNRLPDTKHDAFFVLEPMTAAEICGYIGEVKEEYERVAYYGRVIFWSAPLVTYSRTRWSKLSKDKAMYRTITVRNANTALKLAELVSKPC